MRHYITNAPISSEENLSQVLLLIGGHSCVVSNSKGHDLTENKNKKTLKTVDNCVWGWKLPESRKSTNTWRLQVIPVWHRESKHLKQLMNCSKFDLITCSLESQTKETLSAKGQWPSAWGANLVYSELRLYRWVTSALQNCHVSYHPSFWRCWWLTATLKRKGMPPMGWSDQAFCVHRDPLFLGGLLPNYLFPFLFENGNTETVPQNSFSP